MPPSDPLPTVTLVFLVHNRREELRTSLAKMLGESDYDRERVDAIVVDNASEDGSAEMVREEFPQVELVRRELNVGVSGFNDGFARARGDYVLALDDDCYLPPDGLRRAVAAAERHGASLVSFGVTSAYEPGFRFDHVYRTGLLSFWGCAVLIRREALAALGGYDPDIFVWANELELMLRFFDRGYRHLHLPDVLAVHIKRPGGHWTEYVRRREYLVNTRHFAYIAGKLLRPRDAVEALLAVAAVTVRDALSVDRVAIRALPRAIAGFAHGLRRRAPVRNPTVSRFYRRNFESFASPWWISRPPLALLRALPRELRRAATSSGEGPPQPPSDRLDLYYARRAALYPRQPATLEFARDGSSTVVGRAAG